MLAFLLSRSKNMFKRIAPGSCPNCHSEMLVLHLYGYECLLCGKKFNIE